MISEILVANVPRAYHRLPCFQQLPCRFPINQKRQSHAHIFDHAG